MKNNNPDIIRDGNKTLYSKEFVQAMMTTPLDESPLLYRGAMLENEKFMVELEVLDDDNENLISPALKFETKGANKTSDNWDVEPWLYDIHVNNPKAMEELAAEEGVNDEAIEMIKTVIAVGVKKGWIQKGRDF